MKTLHCGKTSQEADEPSVFAPEVTSETRGGLLFSRGQEDFLFSSTETCVSRNVWSHERFSLCRNKNETMNTGSDKLFLSCKMIESDEFRESSETSTLTEHLMLSAVCVALLHTERGNMKTLHEVRETFPAAELRLTEKLK